MNIKIQKLTQLFFILGIVLSAGTISAATDKCISVNPGSSKSANAEAAFVGSTNMNIANFNLNINGDKTLACSQITIKRMSFAVATKNTITIKNVTLTTSGGNQLKPTTTNKNNITFVFPENYTVKTGESVHLSLIADVGKKEGSTSDQLQVYFKSATLIDSTTGKNVVGPKPIADDLKLLVLNDVDHYIFKSLSRIRNEVRVIELTGMKGYSFCIDEKNTIPKLLKFNTKNAIDKKTGMCR